MVSVEAEPRVFSYPTLNRKSGGLGWGTRLDPVFEPLSFVGCQVSKARAGAPDWLGKSRQRQSEANGVLLGWEEGGVFFGVAEGHDGTAGVGEDAIDGAIVREVVNDGMGGGAEYDEARIEVHGGCQDFDCGMTVGDARFDFSAA